MTPAHAAGRCWDVVVIGAGPAGAIIAREAVRRGLSVLLVDQAAFPRPKVCGCCLNAAALGILDRVGLGAVPARLQAQPLHTFQWAAGRRRVALPLPRGAAVSRAAFDAALIEEAVRRGVEFLPEVCATLDPESGRLRRVILRPRGAAECVDAKVVVVADGLNGHALSRHRGYESVAEPASRLGAAAVAVQAPAWYGPGTIFMACGTGGYVGLVRLEDGRLNIAAAFDPACIKRLGGLGPAAAHILHQTDFPMIDGFSRLVWRGTPALTRRRARVAGDRFFIIGDATGYVEPFTGEGMAWAMGSAVAMAPLVCEAVSRWTPSLAARWALRHRTLVGRRRVRCRWIARSLRVSGVSQTLVGVVSRVPRVATPIVQGINASLVECALS